MDNIMKRLNIMLVSITLGFSSTYACDVCGCASGGVFVGLMPQYKKYFTGLRYQYRSFNGHLNSATRLLRTTERFTALEWYGGLRMGQKLQILAVVPYQWHQQYNQLQQANINGPGDVQVMNTYTVMEKLKLNPRQQLLSHTLQAGLGLKLPTGRWQFTNEGQLGQHANFMPGSGSLDYIALAMYQYNHGNAGLAATASYRFNTPNVQHFKFGNRSQFAVQGFYKLPLRKGQQLTPNAGVQLEHFAKDHQNKQTVTLSGGWLLNTTLGLEYNAAPFTTGFSIQPPIAQYLSQGQVKNNLRAMFYAAMLL